MAFFFLAFDLIVAKCRYFSLPVGGFDDPGASLPVGTLVGAGDQQSESPHPSTELMSSFLSSFS